MDAPLSRTSLQEESRQFIKNLATSNALAPRVDNFQMIIFLLCDAPTLWHDWFQFFLVATFSNRASSTENLRLIVTGEIIKIDK